MDPKKNGASRLPIQPLESAGSALDKNFRLVSNSDSSGIGLGGAQATAGITCAILPASANLHRAIYGKRRNARTRPGKQAPRAANPHFIALQRGSAGCLEDDSSRRTPARSAEEPCAADRSPKRRHVLLDFPAWPGWFAPALRSCAAPAGGLPGGDG